MKWGAIVGTLAGLALAGWLLASFGVREIAALVAQAGWGILAVVAFHGAQIVFSALAWRAVTGSPGPSGPSLLDYVALRWIREAVNNLLPVAQVGGVVVGARLLNRRGLDITAAVAGSIGDLTMEILTQVLFTLIGLALLVALVGTGGVPWYWLAGTGLAVVAAGGFVAGQWFGMAGMLERGLAWLRTRFGWAPAGGIADLDARIRAIYRAPGPLALACLHNSVSWLLGGVEVCLTLHLLGHNVSFAEGLVIESLGQAVRAAGFAIPGAIGVAEGGFVIIGAFFGLGPEVAIALSLIKRLREIVLGVPALLAWHWLERRPVRIQTAA